MLNNTPTEIEALVERLLFDVEDGLTWNSSPLQCLDRIRQVVKIARSNLAALSARPSREAVLRDALAGRLRRIRDAAKDRATNAYERGRFDAACEVLAALLGEPNAIALGEKEEA